MSKDDKTSDAVDTTVVDAVAAKLKEFGATDDIVTKVKALGVETPEDLTELTEADLTAAGLPVVKARKLLSNVKPAEVAAVAQSTEAVIASILPQVPDYASLLDQLRTGGVLKVDRSTVTGLVQAYVANRVGLFDVTEKLAAEIKAYAERNDEPVDPTMYYRLKNQLTRTRYGDLFAAVEGFDGRSVTAAAKKEVLAKVDQKLWPAVREFQARLSGWHDSWFASANNPLALQNTLVALAGGRPGVVPSTSQAPDTGGLHDEADKVNDAANRVFAGEGVQIAAAVAFEASKIREVLANPALPAQVGAANHEQMLKQLGVAVSAADPRFERDLVQYILAILQVKNLASGQDELLYFDALWQLGNQIDWNQLGGTGSLSRLGGSDFHRQLGAAAVRGSDLGDHGSRVRNY